MKSIINLLVIGLAVCVLADTETESKCSKEKPSKSHLLDQDFGMVLTPDDFLTSMLTPFSSFRSPWFINDYIRPWRKLSNVDNYFGSSLKSDKDKFQINLDVQHFAPEEITVKTSGGFVTVEGRHEEKEDEHGFVSRHFSRRYNLPEGTSPETIVSQLSTDGILTITAPRKVEENPGERVVPITQTGPVRREAKESQEETGSCQAK